MLLGEGKNEGGGGKTFRMKRGVAEVGGKKGVEAGRDGRVKKAKTRGSAKDRY